MAFYFSTTFQGGILWEGGILIEGGIVFFDDNFEIFKIIV